jgi:hypothetical protein
MLAQPGLLIDVLEALHLQLREQPSGMTAKNYANACANASNTKAVARARRAIKRLSVALKDG